MAGVGAAFTDIYYQEMTWLLGEGTAQVLGLLLLWDAFMDVSHCTVIFINFMLICKSVLLNICTFLIYFAFDTIQCCVKRHIHQDY